MDDFLSTTLVSMVLTIHQDFPHASLGATSPTSAASAASATRRWNPQQCMEDQWIDMDRLYRFIPSDNG